MDKSGIYCIYFDNIDDKYYVGCSIAINKRILEHKAAFIRGNHQNKYLQSAYNKYGEPQFEVLEYCSVEELYTKEIEYIHKFNSYNNGFNFTTGGDGGGFGEGNGAAIHTEEVYKNILWELAHTSKPYSQIATELNSTVGVIKKIAGLKSHGYLQEVMPEEYQIITDKLNTRDISAKYQGIRYPTLVDPSGNEYSVDNVHKFAEEHGLQYQNLHKVLTGKRKRHKGWEIK